MSNLKQYLNVYNFDTELVGSGVKVNYKGLSTNSIKKLLMYEKETDILMEQDILDSIINLAVVDEGFNVEELLISDRYYLFIKIREATKGNIFEYDYKCSECGKESPKTIDISKLVINKPEEFDKELKLDSLIFEMDYPKRKLQKELISSISKKLTDNEKRVELGLVDIAAFVTGIKTHDGEVLNVDYKELVDFIGDLPEHEMDKIDEWREKNDFTIDLSTNVKCIDCGNEETVNPPLTNFFS